MYIKDSVTQVGSFISFLSPYISEISSERRVFTSGVGKAKQNTFKD